MRLILLTAALLATTAPLTAQEAEPRFSPEAVRAHVEFLADDLLEGRNAGTRGYDLAALYVAAQFEALGLKPGGTKGWYQPVHFTSALLDSNAPATITIGGTPFAEGGDVLVGFTPRTTGKPVEAQAVFVGYGLDAPELGFDDYSGLDVKGKIVVALQGFPKGAPSEFAAHLSSQKAVMAQARGAIGALTVATPASLARMPWARIKGLAKAPEVTWIGDDGKPYGESTIERGGYLNTPAAQALFAGSQTPMARVFATAAKPMGTPRGFPLTQRVRFDRKIVSTNFESSNVLGIIPGSDPRLKDEVVVLMAHLDHDGVDPTGPGSDKTYNGAMDNAAGIATMLEVARALTMDGKRPKRTILFAAVTAEEDGLLGSAYLAKHALPGGGRAVAVVNLDMPVMTYDFIDVVAFGAEHSTMSGAVGRAAQAVGVKLTPDPTPDEGIFTRSDHYSFVREGVPSIMLSTGFGGKGAAAWETFLGKHYHQVSDDLNQPIDWAAGAKFARINYLVAREIADAPEAPRWYADDFFGTVFAKDAVKAPAPGVGKPKRR